MNIFHCDQCHSVVFFENDRCLTCGNSLAFLPESLSIGTLRTDTHQMCRNAQYGVCNEAVALTNVSDLCRWCEFTEIIPDLSTPENLKLWTKLQHAQRRLLYSLAFLGLQVIPKSRDVANGLGFRFLADTSEKVFTGHLNGVITLNISEADDVTREISRKKLGEPYRTLLGHFRHEVGHFFWDRLIRNGNQLQDFRALFGDESVNYEQALSDFYQQRPGKPWQDRHISEYATAHPWEDWAETWAHYLHMTDVLETARSCGFNLSPDAIESPRLDFENEAGDFESKIRNWEAVTFAMNSLNRSMGMIDPYPFFLSEAVVKKLKFIHEIVRTTPSA